ncbi:MAG: UDP-N-acetylmuramoyl-tripeptide--D-alanyl-D-alanine ligase [Gammaproteobacteria bacterium]|nr:UDP-N-acetylmuramoyl-tripeptide--D-alanyl-D-alanine ligase [Gammaproteobacteria bacterium]MCP5137240.1 UDP-N-acetylmuramoyl-tripeptide--D-alanyl-D-alanine ligase [Gammaproteobacteria bacterium]
MIALRLQAAADALCARGVETVLLGGESRFDGTFAGLVIDSRDRTSGALFVALRGDRFDGHDFAADAVANGAGALLVERRLDVDVPQLLVANARIALGAIAAAWRDELPLTVVGITGSNGKTTNKEMVAAILSQCGATTATKGNLNNDIGVPLTLARLAPGLQYAVIEMGANHPGEIAYLSGLARPDVALLANAGAAHLEGFGSLEGVAKAKGEIFDSLGATGRAVINADDRFADQWLERVGARPVFRFGLRNKADFTATWVSNGHGSRVSMQTPLGAVQIDLPLPGEHNVMNALGASAAAVAAGAGIAEIKSGLESMKAVGGRLVSKPGVNGALIIDDTYNANPSSFRAAIAVLAAQSTSAWLVMGDMGELGEDAAQLHADVGERAREKGISRLFALGPMSRRAVVAFGAGARHFESIESLNAALLDEIRAGQLVLVKGSRSMRMERVVAALSAPRPTIEGAATMAGE